MKCLTWNLEWAAAVSDRAKLMQEQIKRINPDVICFTEIVRDFIPGGYCIEANSDYGYLHSGDRRKVLLWSKYSWTDVDSVGDDALPPGRFTSGVSCGIRFVGVCIPWKDAHVKTGRRDRQPWQDHVSYCRGLSRILRRYLTGDEPVCVVGDYNQRIPRATQPACVARALAESIPADFIIPTRGMKDPEGKSLIDHFAVSANLSASVDQIVPRFTSDGTRLSDHVGVVVTLQDTRANNHIPRTIGEAPSES